MATLTLKHNTDNFEPEYAYKRYACKNACKGFDFYEYMPKYI